jgi:hypothetical protein
VEPENHDMPEDPNESITPENLQEKLAAYQQAIKEEYEVSSEADPENIEEYTRDFFKKNIHIFAAQIAHLAIHAESETVRMNCSKYGIEAALADSRSDGDPMRELLTELTKSNTKA